MNPNIPPSKPYQRWGLMAVCFALLCTLSEVLIIYSFWPDSDWGAFGQHAREFGGGVWELLSQHSIVRLKYYFDVLEGYDIRNEIMLAAAGTLSISALLAAVITKAILWVPGGRKGLIKAKGPVLYEGATLKRGCAKHRQKKGHKGGVAVHPEVVLSEKEEEGNVFAFGQHGAGKSVIIKQVLHQLIEKGDVVIIYDEKREYTELFYDPADTVLIAPWDERSSVWEISKDLLNDEDFELIAQRLVSDRAEDPMWSNGARSILAGILAACRANGQNGWGWQDVVDYLSLDNQALRDELDFSYDRASRFIEEGSKTTHGFTSTLMTDVTWLYSLAKAWPIKHERQFSIREWLGGKGNKVKKIIIQAHPEFRYVGAPLCNSMIGLITSIVLARPDSDSSNIWFVLDELGNLPKNESLKEWLSIGRSKGCRTLAGTQSISQLHQAYGEHDTDTLLNLFSTVIALRCGASGGVAEYAAKTFGEAIYERPSYSAENQGEKVTNWQKEAWQLVTASDLVNLRQPTNKGVTGYLTSSGWNAVYKLEWPYPKLDKIAESYVPADWVNARKADSPSATKYGRLRGR